MTSLSLPCGRQLQVMGKWALGNTVKKVQNKKAKENIVRLINLQFKWTKTIKKIA